MPVVEETKATTKPLLKEIKSTDAASNPSCSSSSKTTSILSYFTSKKISCPICYQHFFPNVLEEHAGTCAEEKYDNLIVYDIDDDMDIDPNLDPNETVPCTESNQEVSKEESLLQGEKVLEELKTQQNSGRMEVFKCRRQCAWLDFISHVKKPWANCHNNIVVTFLMESAVDTGGPKREFFAGICFKKKSDLFMERCMIYGIFYV